MNLSSNQTIERKSIELLPEHLIDQIKAGEVIERPSNLIKELVENSIDAGSKKIDIHLIENGMDLISVEDDGKGMLLADLPYAFCRHATSKISSFEDIYKLTSFGFRGEALASISAISRLNCISSPKENLQGGGKISIHGGETISHVPHVSNKAGTSIFIKDLFYNTPARLKFIKSKASEKNSLKRILHSFVLANPHVSFGIKWDEKDKDIYNAATNEEERKKRIEKLLLKKGHEPKGFQKFEGSYEDSHVEGYFSDWSQRGNAGKNQYLFINGRLFGDRQLHSSVMKTIEGYWPYGESGHYVVFLQVPPNQIDVNVHPSKTHIKFFKSSEVFSMVSSSIRKKLGTLNERTHHPMPTNNSAIPSNLEMALPNQAISDFSHSPYQEAPQAQQNSQELFQAEGEFLSFNYPVSETYSLITFLHDLDKASYLLHKGRLLSSYLKSNWETSLPIDENEITPLLISEPFHYEETNIDKYFPVLKELGLEFERIDAKTIVLRTIPNFLGVFEPAKILSPLIKKLSTCSALTLESFLDMLSEPFPMENLTFSNPQWDDIIGSYGFQAAKDMKFISILNDKKLNKLFK